MKLKLNESEKAQKELNRQMFDVKQAKK